MSRSLQVIARCDNCGVTGDESDFEMDRVIDVPSLSRKPKMLDLCTTAVEAGQNCVDTFVKAMEIWLDLARNADVASRPIPQDRSTTPSGEVILCEVEGCTRGPKGGPFVAASLQGLRMHQTRTHGMQPTAETLRRRRAREGQ